MRIRPILTFLVSLVFLQGTSCYKDQSYPGTENTRKIRYVLYTSSDLSDNNETIKFSLFMRNHTKILLDTELVTMKIKEIPHADSKIIIEKTVPGNDYVDLSVGFHYTIAGVGSSQHMDSSAAGETLKVVEFDFK